MPRQQTYVVDQEATFGTVFFMTCGPRLVYTTGPDGRRMPSGEQEAGKESGKLRWNIQGTALSLDGEDQQGLKVGVEADRNPAEGLAPGTPVLFDRLEVGVMTRDGGGAQVWYRAQGLRPVTPANGQPKTTATATASSGKGDGS